MLAPHYIAVELSAPDKGCGIIVFICIPEAHLARSFILPSPSESVRKGWTNARSTLRACKYLFDNSKLSQKSKYLLDLASSAKNIHFPDNFELLKISVNDLCF